MSEKKIIASDGSELKPGMMVLGRDRFTEWTVDIFSHINSSDRPFEFVCAGARYELCIPFEGNEHMVGSNRDVPNREKPFEWGERVLVWDLHGEAKREALFVAYETTADGAESRFIALEKKKEEAESYSFCERATI